jgi:demethylmenaquinone methyltransferase/2-methoxy-6-polyprenyl-1,4-benzoquinol methylase
MSEWLRKFRQQPDKARGLHNYQQLACQYDDTTGRIRQIWSDSIASLRLQPGEQVLDVACGTGETTRMLAHEVGSAGRVTGVEQSEAMVEIARKKLRGEPFGSESEVICCGVENLEMDTRFDAVLMSFTHDALWTPAAVERVVSHCRAGARLAVAGMRFLPWWWGAPVNLVSAFRARRYMTTYVGLREPWRPLLPYMQSFQVEQTYLMGSCYRAVGQVAGPSPTAAQSCSESANEI